MSARGADRRQGPDGTAAVRRRLGAFWRQTFSSLKVPNYRLYFIGQSISLAGTWMQMTAQSWLVLTLTHSSTDLGFIVALQTLPVLLLAPYGGVVADRVDKRRLMIVLQIAMGFQRRPDPGGPQQASCVSRRQTRKLATSLAASRTRPSMIFIFDP